MSTWMTNSKSRSQRALEFFHPAEKKILGGILISAGSSLEACCHQLASRGGNFFKRPHWNFPGWWFVRRVSGEYRHGHAECQSNGC
jgi:hypothetical protein